MNSKSNVHLNILCCANELEHIFIILQQACLRFQAGKHSAYLLKDTPSPVKMLPCLEGAGITDGMNYKHVCHPPPTPKCQVKTHKEEAHNHTSIFTLWW